MWQAKRVVGYRTVNNPRTFGGRMTRDLPRFIGMHPDPALEQARREWAAAARTRLGPVLGAACRLRLAFDTATAPFQVSMGDPAAELTAACADLLQWLHDSPAPSGHGQARAELGAAAGVFRNAAFAFRSLDEAGPGQHAARAEACASMLVQREHHIDTFLVETEPGKSGGSGKR